MEKKIMSILFIFDMVCQSELSYGTNYHGTTAICLVKFSQNKWNCHGNLYCLVNKHRGGNTIKEEKKSFVAFLPYQSFVNSISVYEIAPTIWYNFNQLLFCDSKSCKSKINKHLPRLFIFVRAKCKRSGAHQMVS